MAVRLINRGQVMSAYLENLGTKDSYRAKYEALVKAVDEAPDLIDYAPVLHGKWIDGAFENSKYCSVCNKYATKVHKVSEPIFDYTYCPHCGARMDLAVGR